MTTLATTVATQYDDIRSANAVAASSGASYRRSIRAANFDPAYIRAISATIEMSMTSTLGHTGMIAEKPRSTIRFTDDPVLLAMSDDEYIAALEALGGSVTDDGIGESIDELNAIWRDKLGEIYNAVNDPDPHT